MSQGYGDGWRDAYDATHGRFNAERYDFDDAYEESGELDIPRPSFEDELPGRAAFEGDGLFGGPSSQLFGTRAPMEDAYDQGYYEPGRHELPSGPISAVDLPNYQKAPEPEPDPFLDSGLLVRPYARTGGRTRPDYDLAIEALISTSEYGRESAAELPEHRSICGLCLETRSVAEIAAHLRLPLGVVRVLIGDMAGLGLVLVHQGGLVMGDRPSLAFLERVLSGLRRL
ncbi:DUF742 domain-containing protein [Pseudonocardiaceae bacterium YIM PH 21723]|nr:DUF742 domain-containing protein [Pseudonocardiaceae bacterium YIM PH 21723]